ncbi:endonuclease/exonuclease/phosphatase family protein [Streptomyces sp. ODS28]|uniref:endonuclease/exonuclease/phosphatase family protein n=1 Tax=Streptomyces sp. ODS28 TaxID=3136688 RepID=UPI0031EBD37C
MRGTRRLGAAGLSTGCAVVAAVAVTAVAPQHQVHQPAPRPSHRQAQGAEQQSGPESARAGGRLRVMTFNAWVGGSWVRNALGKQVSVVRKFRPDVIGMQETRGHAARDLAKRLGWHYRQSRNDLGVVSRYPIEQVTGVTSAGAGVRIRMPGGKKAEVWTSHMAYRPYGAYDACYGRMSGKRILGREARSGRTGQAKELAGKLRVKAMTAGATDTPLILVGDFNSPSHLDWTAATRKRHCGYGPFNWPVTKAIAGAGLRDSFRVKHPDPGNQPGNTWSPVYPRHNGSTGRREPQNRTDYITYAGNMRVLHSRTVVVGHPKARPHHRNNVWPSDHKAVLTEFGVS